MKTICRPRLPMLLCALLVVAPVRAEPAPDGSPPASNAVVSAVRPHLTVVEDEGVRIEETRVRGTVTRVRVQSKVGDVPAYEIQVAPLGRESMSDRGIAGRRTWSLLRF